MYSPAFSEEVNSSRKVINLMASVRNIIRVDKFTEILKFYSILCMLCTKSSYLLFLLQLVMIEERRWPLGSKSIDIHGGGGIITTIKWTKNLIAWANQKVI